MQERRHYVRIQTPVMVEFPHPHTMKTERSFSQDVSEGGMKFPTPIRLQIGQELPLSLELPFQQTTIHATGEVVWLREIARLGVPHYEVGVRFRWIDDPDRKRFLQHLSTVCAGRV